MKVKGLRLGAVLVERALGFCGVLVMVVLAAGCGNGGSNAPVAHGLWVPNYLANNVAEFTGKKLNSSGTTAPDLTNSGADLNEPATAVFDKKHDLWVSNYGNGTLVEYTLSQLKQLASNPTPTANVVISGLSGPTGLAFDHSGNLWVAEWFAAELVEFTPSQLATSGTVGGGLTPAVTITSSSFNRPAFLTFDKSGNLWMSDGTSTADGTGSAGEIFEFTPSQLATGGSLTPNVSLATSTLDRPYGFVFGGSGDLWVANFGSSTLQKFASSDIKGPGVIQPAAAVTISATSVTTSTGTANSLDNPGGVGFSSSGNLWVSNTASDNLGSLAKYTPSQLKTTGSPSPKVFIDSDSGGTNLNAPFQFAFGPSIK